jgi:hypothetical protein
MRSRCPDLDNRAVSGRTDDAGVEFGSRGAARVGVSVEFGTSRAVPRCG